MDESERQELISQTAIEVGASWVAAVREDLKREGRPVEGAWPGTIGDARARAVFYVGKALSTRNLPSLEGEELTLVARATYAEAKRVWLQRSKTERSTSPHE